MKNLAAISFLFWICVGFVSAQGAKAQHSGGPSFEDPNRPIEVMMGHEFKIVLDSNPTTGFQWQLSDPLDERIVTLVGTEYDIPKTPGVVGAGGKHIWTFKTVGLGQTMITLKYFRPWEKGVAPIKEATFTVIVRH